MSAELTTISTIDEERLALLEELKGAEESAAVQLIATQQGLDLTQKRLDAAKQELEAAYSAFTIARNRHGLVTMQLNRTRSRVQDLMRRTCPLINEFLSEVAKDLSTGQTRQMFVGTETEEEGRALVARIDVLQKTLADADRLRYLATEAEQAAEIESIRSALLETER